MAKYTVKTLNIGTILRKKSNMVMGADDEVVAFPLLAFLLESEDRKVLIDTGGSVPNGVNWMPYERKEEESIEHQLSLLGVDPDEITEVFITHLHWDHCGSNASFKNAKFYVQKIEYDYLAAEERVGFERALAMQTEYTTIDGDTKDVIPGISVILTPGHSPGSQSVIVDTEDGGVVFSGDMIPTYENIELKVPNNATYDKDVIFASMNKVLDLGMKIMPGHGMYKYLDK